MSEIKLLNDNCSHKGLKVIGVVVNDNIENHLQAAKELKITWTQTFDLKNESASYGINGIKDIPT
jgi:hypothetical protein